MRLTAQPVAFTYQLSGFCDCFCSKSISIGCDDDVGGGGGGGGGGDGDDYNVWCSDCVCRFVHLNGTNCTYILNMHVQCVCECYI